MPGNDSFTKLLVHGNGTDASTSFIDNSSLSLSLTAVGNAQVDTAQSKFGGASILLDGSGDYVSSTDHADLDLGTNDFAIDTWFRLTSTLGNPTIFGRTTDSNSYMYLTLESGSMRFRDYNSGNVVDFTNVLSLSTNVWYHIAVTRSGSTFRMFLDGTLLATTATTANAMTARAVGIDIGAMTQNAGYIMNGWIDEFRYTNGDARWTASFTPPIAEYDNSILVTDSETISVIDSLSVNERTNSALETISVIDSLQVIEGTFNNSETISIIDSLNVNERTNSDSETISVTDSLSVSVVSTNTSASFGTRILSFNPLIFVTNTIPSEIVKVDTTNPENITWQVEEIIGIDNVIEADLNTVTEFIFVAGANGKVCKIDINDITIQTIINLSDIDDLLTLQVHSLNALTLTGTENIIGELYLLDDREIMLMDADLQVLHTTEMIIDTDIEIIQALTMDSDIQVLGLNTAIMNCDFKCLTQALESIVPIKLTDFEIYVDSVLLDNVDVLLDSITITHTIGEKSTAQFTLSRRHDRLNTDLAGNTRTITNQNTVIVKIQGRTEFTGKISSLDCQYTNVDQVIVTAESNDEGDTQYQNITLSLPSLDARLGLYNILVQNPRIYNPYIDPTEENPKKYKGIFVNLGTKTRQSSSSYTNLDGTGSTANAIQNGSFNPLQNWTYFWSPTVNRFGNFTLGQTSSRTFNYIGTSLSPVSSNLWDLTNAKHRSQRIYDDIVTLLGTGTMIIADYDDVNNVDSSLIFADMITQGYINGSGVIQDSFKNLRDYTDLGLSYGDSIKKQIYDITASKLGYYVGIAPYKEISTRNGILISKFKWVDEPNGLYSIKDAGYDFTNFAQIIADLEYQKILNINGDILPETSCAFNLTIDAYYYYGLKLLTRINVDNTIQSNIYNNANGFPVSIKNITISSGTMNISLQADNQKSTEELEEIDGLFPNEDDEQYNQTEIRTLVALKTDMNTFLGVE